jgi:hypothetical protein
METKTITLTFYTLRISIDGKWTVEDFSFLFNSINKLYEIYMVVNRVELHFAEAKMQGFIFVSRGSIPSMLNELLSLLAGNKGSLDLIYNKAFPLEVKQIKYSSPGITDFVGLSGVLGHFKDILFHFFPDEKTKMEIEILKQQKDKLMIENLQKLEIDPYLIKQLYLYEEININNIKSLIDREKITSIEIIKDDKDDKELIIPGI